MEHITIISLIAIAVSILAVGLSIASMRLAKKAEKLRADKGPR